MYHEKRVTPFKASRVTGEAGGAGRQPHFQLLTLAGEVVGVLSGVVAYIDNLNRAGGISRVNASGSKVTPRVSVQP